MVRYNAAFALFLFSFLHQNETSMGPEGDVSNCDSSIITLCLLFLSCVVILCGDNLAWRVRGNLFFTRHLFPRARLGLVVAQELQKNLLGSSLGDLSFTRALTQRFISQFPRGAY